MNDITKDFDKIFEGKRGQKDWTISPRAKEGIKNAVIEFDTSYSYKRGDGKWNAELFMSEFFAFLADHVKEDK